MEKVKVLIIEDELPAREIIKAFLRKYEQFNIIGECENGYDGAIRIRELKPDLVFLDIQMPKLSGFEMLELLEDNPLIIFTTAYDEFALKAFEFNATDYLLKPFSPERFQQAISKALMALERHEKPSTRPMVDYVRSQQENLSRIVVKVKNRIEIVLVKNIERIEAQDDYVFIYTVGGERFLKDMTMKYLEEHLDAHQFVRVHRSHIVRVDRIRRIIHEGADQHSILTKNEEEVPSSRSGYKKLRAVIGL